MRQGAGFGHRQLLKARGAYLGERIVLGATGLRVHAFALFLRGRVSRAVGCWPRREIRTEMVTPQGSVVDGSWPALRITDRYRNTLAELQALQFDDDAWKFFTLLVRTNPVPPC